MACDHNNLNSTCGMVQIVEACKHLLYQLESIFAAQTYRLSIKHVKTLKYYDFPRYNCCAAPQKIPSMPIVFHILSCICHLYVSVLLLLALEFSTHKMSKLKPVKSNCKKAKNTTNTDDSTFSLINRFAELKKPIFDNYSKSFIRKYSKLAPLTQIQLSAQAVQNELEYTAYIEYFIKLVYEHNADTSLVQDVLVFLKNSVEANYDYIRILLKCRMLDVDFLTSYVDDPFLAIILGEYMLKYGIEPEFMNRFGDLKIVIYLSYVCNNNYVLLDHFQNTTEFLFNNLDVKEIIDGFTVLITKVSQESVLNLRNGIAQITKCNNRANNTYNDLLLDTIISYPDFFRDCIDTIVKDINLEDTKKIMLLLQKYTIPTLFDNATPQEYLSFMYNANASLFNLYYGKHSTMDLSNDDLISIKLLHFYYSRQNNDNFAIDCIEAKYIVGTPFTYSSAYVNGFSFIDKAYIYNKEDITNFMNTKIDLLHEQKIFELQLECLSRFLIDRSLVKEFESNLKAMIFVHKYLHPQIFELLSHINDEYKIYKNIAMTNPANIKTLMLLFDQLFTKTKDFDFFFDIMFLYKGVAMKSTKYKNDSRYKQRMSQMNKNEKLHNLESNGKENIELENDISNCEDTAKKMKISETKNSGIAQIGQLQDAVESVKMDITYYLEHKIEIPATYELKDSDKKHTDRIFTLITAYVLSLPSEFDNTIQYKNIIAVLNIYNDPKALSELLANIYKFYRVKDTKHCVKLVKEILKQVKTDVWASGDTILNIMKYDGSIFEIYIEKLSLENISDILSSLQDVKRYINSIQKVIDSKIKSKEYERESIVNTLHNLVQNEETTNIGFVLSYENDIKDEKLIEIAQKTIKSGRNQVVLSAYRYLVMCDASIDTDFLYELVFKRAKLDELAIEILKTIEQKEEHLERVYEMFYLDPYKYLDILPRIQSNGFGLTNEMIIELVTILKNVYNDDRDKIYDVINNSVIEDKLEFNLAMVKDLDSVNHLSKILCIKLLGKNYVSDYSIFVVLIKVLANEDNLECIGLILDILRNNKKKFYDRIEEYKRVDKLQRLMFRIYPLVMKDKAYYNKLMKTFKNCFEYDFITSYYNLK